MIVALRIGFWLGWKIESNWTDPLLFFIYAVVRPLGAALILVAMFFAVSGGERGPLLDFLVVGSAAWPLVLSGLSGLALAMVTDREHWHMIRPVYTSPVSWPGYLVGRSLAMTASTGLVGALVTLLVGRLVLGVDIAPSLAGAAYLAVATALGLVAVIAIGLVAVAYLLSVPGEAWRLPEALSASLYLVCGAVFPVSVLPGALGSLSRIFPFTWWLEALRRGLLGGALRSDTSRSTNPQAVNPQSVDIVSFPSLSHGDVLALLALTTAVAAVIATLVFRRAEHRARRLGTLDRETGY
jgi:ABC-2 type transport system permease protein